MYKFETHLHTSEGSLCAFSTAKEMIDAACEHKYSGIVITEHFPNGNTRFDSSLPWKDFVACYAEHYNKAKEYGKQKGIVVLFGYEESYLSDLEDFRGKEILVYGISPEVLAEKSDYLNLSFSERVKFIRENKGLIIHSHPFRVRTYISNANAMPDPELFDGVECYNYFNEIEENLKAFIYAQNTGKIKFSGTDIHKVRFFGNSGMDFDNKIETISDFINEIRLGNYKMIAPYFLENN